MGFKWIVTDFIAYRSRYIIIVLGLVYLVPCENALCYVNGKQVTERALLQTGSRVILGKSHVFRFNNPQQAREMAERRTPSETPTDTALGNTYPMKESANLHA